LTKAWLFQAGIKKILKGREVFIAHVPELPEHRDAVEDENPDGAWHAQ
jgi:hypothetical protein